MFFILVVIQVSLITGLDSPLEHGTGLFDWNMGLDYLTGTWDVCPLMETQHPTGLDWNIVHRNMPAMHKLSTT